MQYKDPAKLCDNEILDGLKTFVKELPLSENAIILDHIVTLLDRFDSRMTEIENNYVEREWD
jgi:hypothetical protein